jgi:hypothetical protein
MEAFGSMATLSRRVSVFSDGSLQADGLPRNKAFYRVLHERELASNLPHTTPPDRPEVRALYPSHFSPFGKPWQMLAWKMNPLLSAGNMTAVYHTHLWIANDQGFGDDNDPRANFFENTHLTENLPKVEALTCGGNLLSVVGELGDDYIVETLDWHNPPPSPSEINGKPWLLTVAVNMGTDGTPRRFSQGTQPNGFVPGVRHPLLADPTRFVVTIPKWRLMRWTASTPPDPYRLYL